ncbi:hypothetical protein MGH68_17510 [Erysipelothrix sp. D19-032]
MEKSLMALIREVTEYTIPIASEYMAKDEITVDRRHNNQKIVGDGKIELNYHHLRHKITVISSRWNTDARIYIKFPTFEVPSYTVFIVTNIRMRLRNHSNLIFTSMSLNHTCTEELILNSKLLIRKLPSKSKEPPKKNCCRREYNSHYGF